MNKFYITTPIFYVNAKPHIGHAYTMIASDVLARWKRQNGFKTFFLTGTDEHGIKIVKSASAVNKNPREFADEISLSFQGLTKSLNISNDYFIRTSNSETHWPGVIKMWQAIASKGDIYKGEYQGLYCVGHEAFLKKSDLKDGVCPDHKTEPEKIEEENYFFKLSNYKKKLKELYESGEIKIYPQARLKEVLNMLEDLDDISFSRPSKDLSWGIPVPGDDSQTIYVWCDALTNYLTGIGFGKNEDYKDFWPADTHVIGKDILRFHTIIWPAMLLSAGLEVPRSVSIHGFITVEGDKMSKTIGNVIDPAALIEKYGLDPVRYFLLREIPSTDDGDFSYTKLEQRYNGDLANGLGNLVQRVATLIETNLDGGVIYKKELENVALLESIYDDSEFERFINEFRLHDALAEVWKKIALANSYVNDRKPWEEAKQNPENFLATITNLVSAIHHITWLLKPFIPATANQISGTFSLPDKKDIPENHKFLVKKGGVLFPRL